MYVVPSATILVRKHIPTREVAASLDAKRMLHGVVQPCVLLNPHVTFLQTSNEVYGFSKLRRFLAYLNSMTQDTLRFLVQASLDEFVRCV